MFPESRPMFPESQPMFPESRQEVADHKEDQERTMLLLEEEMGSNESLKLKIAHLEQKIYISHIDYSASMTRLGDFNKVMIINMLMPTPMIVLHI
jgi:hypothetical protein